MNRKETRNANNKAPGENKANPLLREKKGKEEALKKAEVLEHRAFGKDLKNITLRRNPGDIKEKSKDDVKPSKENKVENGRVQSKKENIENEGVNQPIKKKETTTSNNIFDFSNQEFIKVGDTFIRNKNFNQPEIKNPFKKSSLSLTASEALHKDNPQYYIDYSREVSSHLKATEKLNQASKGYLKNHKNLSINMRFLVVDWLMEVHSKFSLLPETLFLCVNLLDRYMDTAESDKTESKEFQLVGVAALLIASKYEEIYAPEVRDFVYISNKSYTAEQILAMEGKILSTLNFEVLHVSAYRMLERFAFVNCDDLSGKDHTKTKTFYLAQFFLELGLLDYELIDYSPSIKAAAALYTARTFILKMDKVEHEQEWTKELRKETGYDLEDLKQFVKEIVKLVGVVRRRESSFRNLLGKFAAKEFMGVGRIFISSSQGDKKEDLKKEDQN